jgi:hypothetical protein
LVAKHIIFGSDGTSGKLIREWIGDGVTCVDIKRLDYLKEGFEAGLVNILEKDRPEVAFIASGRNPAQKVSSLSFNRFSLDNAIVNFMAPFRVCTELVKHGAKRVIVFTSAAGMTAPAGCAEYAAWKAALNAAVISLAYEVGAEPDGPQINLYSPGANPSNPTMKEDLGSILKCGESGFFFVRYESHFVKLPIGNLCYKVGLQTERSSLDTTSPNPGAGATEAT